MCYGINLYRKYLNEHLEKFPMYHIHERNLMQLCFSPFDHTSSPIIHTFPHMLHTFPQVHCCVKSQVVDPCDDTVFSVDVCADPVLGPVECTSEFTNNKYNMLIALCQNLISHNFILFNVQERLENIFAL